MKGVEIGDGFDVASRPGSEAHDPIVWDEVASTYRRTSANAGGIEGGMSTGEVLVAHVAMKPLATLNRPVLATVDTATKEAGVSFRERTDVTAVPAMGVVAEAMAALVLANGLHKREDQIAPTLQLVLMKGEMMVGRRIPPLVEGGGG